MQTLSITAEDILSAQGYHHSLITNLRNKDGKEINTPIAIASFNLWYFEDFYQKLINHKKQFSRLITLSEYRKLIDLVLQNIDFSRKWIASIQD